MVNDEIVSG